MPLLTACRSPLRESVQIITPNSCGSIPGSATSNKSSNARAALTHLFRTATGTRRHRSLRGAQNLNPVTGRFKNDCGSSSFFNPGVLIKRDTPITPALIDGALASQLMSLYYPYWCYMCKRVCRLLVVLLENSKIYSCLHLFPL